MEGSQGCSPHPSSGNRPAAPGCCRTPLQPGAPQPRAVAPPPLRALRTASPAAGHSGRPRGKARDEAPLLKLKAGGRKCYLDFKSDIDTPWDRGNSSLGWWRGEPEPSGGQLPCSGAAPLREREKKEKDGSGFSPGGHARLAPDPHHPGSDSGWAPAQAVRAHSGALRCTPTPPPRSPTKSTKDSPPKRERKPGPGEGALRPCLPTQPGWAAAGPPAVRLQEQQPLPSVPQLAPRLLGASCRAPPSQPGYRQDLHLNAHTPSGPPPLAVPFPPPHRPRPSAEKAPGLGVLRGGWICSGLRGRGSEGLCPRCKGEPSKGPHGRQGPEQTLGRQAHAHTCPQLPGREDRRCFPDPQAQETGACQRWASAASTPPPASENKEEAQGSLCSPQGTPNVVKAATRLRELLSHWSPGTQAGLPLRAPREGRALRLLVPCSHPPHPEPGAW